MYHVPHITNPLQSILSAHETNLPTPMTLISSLVVHQELKQNEYKIIIKQNRIKHLPCNQPLSVIACMLGWEIIDRVEKEWLGLVWGGVGWVI
ncbi:hypothetical protein ASPCADRAFT_209050 [Aspergillus carbonarius ITEM 5010]|uniref:Uncharacterized protein n=1 Tax=Aspergillus carbonarius (strain ITEM 5010) TaxID=602072 RepID=A0A1R3RH22_ASPC5|nr:hypothetical protein ASPCADRAFT_209050 [Aspergillus carbonarius ITEM 5010]